MKADYHKEWFYRIYRFIWLQSGKLEQWAGLRMIARYRKWAGMDK